MEKGDGGLDRALPNPTQGRVLAGFVLLSILVQRSTGRYFFRLRVTPLADEGGKSRMKKHSGCTCPPGTVRIFRPYIRTKDGRVIYPKHGRVFCLCVKRK